jgi:hypothetical protein
MSDFTVEMDKLAATLAKDANMAEKAFSDRLDAFKTLMPYYALLKKTTKAENEENVDLPNFGSFQRRIHSVT